MIVGRRFEVLEEAAKEMNFQAIESQQGGKAIPVQGDIFDKAGVNAFYEKAIKIIDKLDFLVNSAGFSANWKVQGAWVRCFVHQKAQCELALIKWVKDKPEELEAKLWSIEEWVVRHRIRLRIQRVWAPAVVILERVATDNGVIQ